jgi:glutathione S-transferase
MKLYQSPTSPFVRMVRAAAEIKGLSGRLELVNARADQTTFEALNPLNKVPTLVTDDGETLIESRLICQYLDGLSGGVQLYPKEDAARRKVLQQEALILGVLDAVVLRRMESRKPDGPPSKWWDDRQKRKVDIGLDLIERELAVYTGEPTVIPIMLGCMCHFMDRVSPDDWHKTHPKLARWYEGYRTEPHMAATEVNE